MNVLQSLTELYNHLSFDSTYRNVCKGILENLEEAADGSIYDIAELTSSSRTTIWRMVQKLGYQNFTDFHHELKRAVKQYTYYNRLLPSEQSQDAQNVKDAMLAETMRTYEIMRDQIDAAEVEKTAEELSEADKVVIYTPFKSSAILSLQQNLAIDGKETGYYCLLPDMLEDSQTLTEQSIVIVNMIEHVETMDMEPVFVNIKAQKARVYGASVRYKRYMDRELFRGSTEKVVTGVLLFELYFLMLSEIYRMKYIW